MLMYFHEITTYYRYSTDAFPYDFAVFALRGKQIVMKWFYGHRLDRLGRVGRCEFFEEASEDYEKEWHNFERYAESVKEWFKEG